MSHYYEGRIRPRQAHVFGLIDVWSRLGAKIPALANFLTQAPGFSALAKVVVGIPKQRRIPPIAAESFTRTLAPQPQAAHKGDRPHVILWPDTFNNYYHPNTLAAAAEVLDAAGFFGPHAPAAPYAAGVPCMNSACSIWRLLRILEALRNGHYHHKSILKMSGEQRLLDKLGLDYEILDSGCCGMAGSFGFEKDKHAVSIACAERVLLPAVRQAAEDTLIIADGFSCREQIAQCTERRAMHIAEITRL
ncbi:MAG: hypothetical protein ACREX8_06140, partial [Gammaproteobacteria bacterium]